MDCPVCSKVMKKVLQDVTFNSKDNGKAYSRTLFLCKQDDTWITVEVPKKINEDEESDTGS